MFRTTFAFAFAAASVFAQSTPGVPRPEKADLPYLLHAGALVPTELSEAKEEKRRNDTVYAVQGASSTARTPLAEPIFILKAEKLIPEKLELYKLEVRDGRREVVFPENRNRAPRPYRMSITRLEQGLFRMEAAATLENGQYVLTPAGSNQVFLFEVF
jgi:hypothetical protein